MYVTEDGTAAAAFALTLDRRCAFGYCTCVLCQRQSRCRVSPCRVELEVRGCTSECSWYRGRALTIAGSHGCLRATLLLELDIVGQGPCQRVGPHFGLVKRAMNRPPHPRDFWWARHQVMRRRYPAS